MTNIRRRSG